jgi:hypothetical protein
VLLCDSGFATAKFQNASAHTAENVLFNDAVASKLKKNKVAKLFFEQYWFYHGDKAQ